MSWRGSRTCGMRCSTRAASPTWVGIGGSIIFAVLAIIVIPFLYTPVKWYAHQVYPGVPILHTPAKRYS